MYKNDDVFEEFLNLAKKELPGLNFERSGNLLEIRDFVIDGFIIHIAGVVSIQTCEFRDLQTDEINRIIISHLITKNDRLFLNKNKISIYPPSGKEVSLLKKVIWLIDYVHQFKDIFTKMKNLK